jgi:hypothetical protein
MSNPKLAAIAIAVSVVGLIAVGALFKRVETKRYFERQTKQDEERAQRAQDAQYKVVVAQMEIVDELAVSKEDYLLPRGDWHPNYRKLVIAFLRDAEKDCDTFLSTGDTACLESARKTLSNAEDFITRAIAEVDAFIKQERAA